MFRSQRLAFLNGRALHTDFARPEGDVHLPEGKDFRSGTDVASSRG